MKHRLKDKLNQVYDLMQVLGISFHIQNNIILVFDGQDTYKLEDLESENLTDFPTDVEFKLKSWEVV